MKNRVMDWVLAERDRLVLWLPVGLGFGVAAYFALGAEPPLWAGPVGAVGLMVAVFGLKNRGGAMIGGVRAALFVLAIMALGFTAASVRTVFVAAPQLEGRIGPVTVEGRTLDVESFPDGMRLTLDQLAISMLGPDQTPRRVRLRLKGNQPTVVPGDWVRARAIISPPSPPVAPGAFDFQRHAYFQGLGGFGFSLGAITVYRRAGDPVSGVGRTGLDDFWLAVAHTRNQVVRRILAAFGPDEAAIAGMAAALMTGERRAIPEPVLEDMRRSGIAHLLAISGLHVGLVAGILFVGLRAMLALIPWLALRVPIKKWAAAAALAGALAYALLAGATVPTQRAFLMIGLVLLAVMVDRRGLSMRMVAFAATVILLLRPESLLGASFQLSFAAVVALIAAYEHYAGVGRYRGGGMVKRVGVYLTGVALTTLIAGAATAPYAAFHFNQVADFGLITNLIAVPLTALWVMPWAIVAFALMPFGLEAVALTPMGWGIAVVEAAAHMVANWPGAVTRLPAGGIGALVLVTLGGLWLCLWRGRVRLLGAGGIVAGVAVLAMATPPDVLIGGDGKLMAVRTAAGEVALSTRTAKRFERAIWLRRQGADDGATLTFAALAETPQPGLRCDGQGCVYEKAGVRATLVNNGLALAEDCRTPGVDVVIATVPARGRCRGPGVVIDRFDLWKRGAHALWIDEDGAVTVQTVAGARGVRPWTGR